MIPHSRPWIDDADIRSVDVVLASGQVAQGNVVQRFEEAVAEMHNAGGAVATANGTAALVLALRAIGAKPGGEVILPSYVCVNVLQAVCAVGATPVFADVGQQWTLSGLEVAPLVTAKTSAIVLVHTFGIAADIEPILALGVPVVEDCCQALGALENGRLAGSGGSVAVFSFHGTKCLTTGEGGMAISSSPEVAARMRNLRDGAGTDETWRHAAPMSDLQAALGISQLKRYPQFLARRSAIASRYFRELPGHLTERLRSVAGNSMFFRFPLHSPEIRVEEDIGHLASRGVAARHGVDRLLHRKQGLPDTRFPATVDSFQHTLSIPIYPSLTETEQDKVIEGIIARHAH